MAEPKSDPPASVLIAAIFSRHVEAVKWAREQAENSWGSVVLASPLFDHSETRYYESEMGSGLQKQFFVFDGIYDPAKLSATKLQSNAWEGNLAKLAEDQQVNYSESRPVNIDPGYLTLTKLVLASAKDRAHRIYLSDGIYAEESLYYLDQRWQSRPWTYPDYQRDDFQRFFVQVREHLKTLLAGTK